MRMRIILTFAIIAFFLSSQCLFSQSQPPSPRPFKINQEQKHQTETKNEKRESSNDTTNNSSSLIKEIPTTSKNSQSTNITTKTNITSANDYRFLDVLTFIFTAILAISTSLLWWSTRKAFIATNRPKLRVRDIQFDGFIKDFFGLLQVNIANTGGSNAKEIEFYAVYALRNENRIAPWIEDLDKCKGFGTDSLKPGERGGYRPNTDSEIVKKYSDEIMREIISFYIIGRVKCKDANGIISVTGFSWWYNVKLGEFYPSENIEGQYNYAD
jgi:hypothetical protein